MKKTKLIEPFISRKSCSIFEDFITQEEALKLGKQYRRSKKLKKILKRINEK